MIRVPHPHLEQVVPAADGTLLVELAQMHDRVQAGLVASLAEFIRAGAHDVDGWPSPVSWVTTHLPVTSAQATRLVLQARRVTEWPALAERWFAGEVSTAQFETVVGVVGRHHVELYAAHDAEVSPLLVGLTVAETRTAIRHWVARADALVDAAAPSSPGPDASVHLSRTFGGRGRLDADLDADTTAIVETALRVFAPDDTDTDGPRRSVSERRAQALRDLCTFALDHHGRRGRRGRQHPHVTVVLDLPDLYRAVLDGLGVRTADDLEAFFEWRVVSAVEEAFIRHAFAHRTGCAETVDGHPLTPEAVTAIFGAGSTMARVLTADSRVLDHGRSVRLATDSLRDAMLLRDRGCRFPGCDSPATWIDAHHLRHWDHGGPTDLDNLAALCSGHHGVVHRHGWSVEIRPDTTAVFTRPDGTTLSSPPPRATPTDRLPLHPPRSAPGPTGGPSGRGSPGPAPGIPPGPPTPVTHPLWVLTVDAQGRPTSGTRGPATFSTTWDDTPPAERDAADTGIRRRVRDLAAVGPRWAA